MLTHRTRWLAPGLGLCLALGACNGSPAKSADEAHGPPLARTSSAEGREKVAITVYNQNFGLVREIRNVNLGDGRVELEFQDVSAHIQPETVHIKPLGQGRLDVLEQNYRYDLLTPEKLLEKSVGKQVKLYRYDETTGKEQSFDAEVLAAEEGVVLKIGNEITYGWPGRIAFPEVPENLISKPTLVWLLASDKPKQKVEVSYLTGNLSWKSDYVMVVNADDTRGDLTGWVTLDNQSGTAYENAELKLVAGDVQKIAPPQVYDALASAEAAADEDEASGFREEGFFEYHLYTLERPTTLLDKEQKQVTLLEAHDAKIQKKLIFYGAQHYYRGRYGQVVSNQKIGVYLDLKNEKANNLGMALPKGTVRVYKADKSGAKQFIGEDHIDHTPKDEKIRIKMGEAFDVVGERKQTDWRAMGHCAVETAWEVELRNHKDTASQVEVYEPIGGEWEILQSSHPAKKKDAHTFTFDVKVPANGKTKITYRVRVQWC